MAVNRFPVGLRGAGYDDRDNNNAYRNRGDDYRADCAACERGRHRIISFEFSLEVSLMQDGLGISCFNGGILGG